jgi:hypothetical protein
MSSAKLTLLGFNSYFNNMNDDLFKYLTVPTGLTKETLTDNILMRGGEFEVLYSDPNFMQKSIGAWSEKWQGTMKRWVDALAIDYNPLENYDRFEDWTDNDEGSGASSSESISNRSSTRGETDTLTSSSTDTQTNERDSDNPPTHTTSKSAYDSNGYEPYTKEVDTGKWKQVDSVTSNQTNGISANESDNINVKDNNSSVLNNNSVHSGRIHGNIGVTTSQQMLKQELDLGYWNVYEKITELFLQEFVIPVYS